MAEVWGDYEIGLRLTKSRVIQRVQRPVIGDGAANSLIDLRTVHVFLIDNRTDHHRSVFDFSGKITFVTDAHQMPGEPERGDDFRCPREKRADPQRPRLRVLRSRWHGRQ
jgi:hypothetical protein